MGNQKFSIAKDPESRKKYLRHLLHDVEAIDQMIREDLIEKGKRRIGAEQEFCIVDKYFKPSSNAPDILQKIDNPHFTSELARYNLEINLDPFELKGDCFKKMESQLKKLMRLADKVVSESNEKIILTGILPSIDYRAVQMNYLTPKPRYEALSKILSDLRGGDFELNITGVDELILTHNNILFEACNTSFQCHYQTEPKNFADMYNWAQLISGPVLSICANSPLLIGKQLWAETRIPLFQQSIDTRGKGYHLRERQQRVTFGNRWINSVTDVYKNDIARHTILFMTEIEKDSLEDLKEGNIPSLDALSLHNGTVYKWNRPCYGVSKGIPHLRIENRYIPAGPTIEDEMANLTFWAGLMSNLPKNCKNIWCETSFDDAKENFYKAAMWGIQSGMIWNGKMMPAKELILEKLLPRAEEGLRKLNVNEKDIKQNLSVIENRADRYGTGSRWLINSYRRLRSKYDRDEASVALTAIMYNRRLSDKPVHEWENAKLEEVADLNIAYDIVSNVMSTDLVTVNEHDLAEMVNKVMEWRQIRHMPVEDNHGNLKGIITKKRLNDYLKNSSNNSLAVASDVMEPSPVTIGPNSDIKYAMLLMIDKGLSCLPVIEKNQLIGIITDHDTQEIWNKMSKSINAKN
jgi:CBS domain-containing protein